MRLTHVESNHAIEIDDITGLPSLINRSIKGSNFDFTITSTLKIETGGGERRNPVGGLEYFDTTWSEEVKKIGEPFISQSGEGVTWVIPVEIGPAAAQLTYKFNRNGPAISFGVNFLGNQKLVVRNLVADLNIDLTKGNWFANVPGNGLRSNIQLEELKDSTGISPMGGLRGSSGWYISANLI